MIAQGISGLMRPLLSGLNVSKVRFIYLCGVTEWHPTLAKQGSKRVFSSTHKLQDAPGELRTFSRFVAKPYTKQHFYLKKLDAASLGLVSADQVTVHFINRDGERLTATAKEGQSLLEVVINQNLSIDGFGACEGTLACSTCHLIFEKNIFQKLDAISDEELDMLDLAYGLTDTSRLGCQVCIKKSMDGSTVRVPVDVSDIRTQLEVGKQNKQ